MSEITAQVGISGASYVYDILYTYKVPKPLVGAVCAGVRVIVPFGRGNRRRIGVVIKTEEGDPCTNNCKEISSVIDSRPVIGDEQLGLLLWMKETVFCTYFEAFKTLIPPGMGMSFAPRFKLTGKKPSKGDVSDNALGLFSSAAETENNDELELLMDSDPAAAEELIGGGYVARTEAAKQRIRDDTVSMVRLLPAYGEREIKLTAKQKAAAVILEREGSASVKELCYLVGCTPQVIKNLVRAGAAELFEYEVIKTPEISEHDDISAIDLSPMQKNAFDGISAMISEKKAAAALLYGVTGSGKTPVFAKLIEHTLSLGRNVIMLIPEISLTPQTLNRFRRLFGDTVAVMHSGLSLSMRSNEYKRIKAGKCRIVVGTRSAVFAPLDNIGLIIVDEEGERTYKSESSPRYNAKEAAGRRCLYHNCVLLFASATPSVESYYNAERGKYRLFTLPERYIPPKSGQKNIAPAMPYVRIIDMTGTGRIFSEELITAVNDNLSRGEQSILLLNRRGYHTCITCRDCKEAISCPNCGIPLTYHKANGRLICHYCGYSLEYAEKCPVCGGRELRPAGMGTQRLEEELAECFPAARILRMDADTTYSRYAYDKRFSEFGSGSYDIMVGTQMIAKGLDFPNVTLVGVLNADKSLFSGDFRSYERTFSLITQVVGRSGRGQSKGRAYIQTFIPDHYIINLAALQDYPSFYRQEIAMRKALIYPPFCDICVIGFSGTDDKKTAAAAEAFSKLISEGINTAEKMPLRVIGPSKCAIERINGRYRHRIIIKCRNNHAFRKFIGDIRISLAKLSEFKGISVYIDLNGDIAP